MLIENKLYYFHAREIKHREEKREREREVLVVAFLSMYNRLFVRNFLSQFKQVPIWNEWEREREKQKSAYYNYLV